MYRGYVVRSYAKNSVIKVDVEVKFKIAFS